MRLILALTALSALTLAACSDQPVIEGGPPADAGPEVEAPADAPADAPAMLGGVDLAGDIRVIGTEPFWNVELTDDGMLYQGVDRPEQRAPRPEPVVQGTVATWTTTTEQGNALEVTLMETECSDGMSDRTYPLTARVVIADETLNGCAATPLWMMSTGEDGQPREG